MTSLNENNVYYIEGLAMNGLINSFSKRKCDKQSSELIVETITGEKISTGCIDDEVINNILVTLSLYSKWGEMINLRARQ